MKKNRIWKLLFGALTLLGSLGLIWQGVMALVVQKLLQQPLQLEAATIGIIGGADGPTAIFLTVNPARWIEPVFYLALLAIGICGLLWLKKTGTRPKNFG